MSEDRNALLRNKVADFLDCSDNATPAFELMGTGFTSINESPNAQTDSVTYVNEITTSSDITKYETEFAYESHMIPSQKAILKLWKDGRNHHVGADAQHVYVRVDLYNPILTEAGEAYTARKFIVSNEVSDFEGDGGEKITVSGTLHAVGDPVFGKFDMENKTFTEGDYAGKYDDGGLNPSIVLNAETGTINIAGTLNLIATTVPVGEVVTWSTSNSAVATVAGGTVTGEGAGTATITAKITVAGVEYTATCAVTVEPVISLDKTSETITTADTLDITATTLPATASITWSSSDDTIATVAAGTGTGVGTVTPVTTGTVTITASITEAGITKTATCEVEVTA